ncbi:Cell wall alpha-1,3-glucan synthase ags1 [Puccinia graminis f. sp. tritici]|uniref:Cell wall alpha-1,3-glucan synthase ags1 n=1 Tax=Puccinia graminis f. sp. tritici TaxID=56615 RepID=A0A5B0M5N7_PUCGR|nr:Cell wall alpha-1,3-glucan synthase ags1 [Puccinia graminis f. sp. tritici]
MKIDMEEFRSDPFSTRGSMDSFRADHSEETITDFTRQSVHLRPSRSPYNRNGSSPTGLEVNASTSPHSPRTSDGYDSEGRDASPLVTKRGARDSRVSHEMDRPMDGKRISVAPSLHPNYNASQEENDQYGSFLTKANRQLNRKLTKKLTITYGRQAAKDPFIPGTRNTDHCHNDRVQ